MKIVASEKNPAFNPVTIEITVQSAVELDALACMACLDDYIPGLVRKNYSAILAGIVCEFLHRLSTTIASKKDHT